MDEHTESKQRAANLQTANKALEEIGKLIIWQTEKINDEVRRVNSTHPNVVTIEPFIFFPLGKTGSEIDVEDVKLVSEWLGELKENDSLYSGIDFAPLEALTVEWRQAWETRGSDRRRLRVRNKKAQNKPKSPQRTYPSGGSDAEEAGCGCLAILFMLLGPLCCSATHSPRQEIVPDSLNHPKATSPHREDVEQLIDRIDDRIKELDTQIEEAKKREAEETATDLQNGMTP